MSCNTWWPNHALSGISREPSPLFILPNLNLKNVDATLTNVSIPFVIAIDIILYTLSYFIPVFFPRSLVQLNREYVFYECLGITSYFYKLYMFVQEWPVTSAIWLCLLHYFWKQSSSVDQVTLPIIWAAS